MTRSNTWMESKTALKAQTGTIPDEGALLAAALAATLVEYQSLVCRNSDVDFSEATSDNWRVLACLDRLRSGL